jgi:membrane protease YdiL (CAAX protease family)
MIYGFTGVSYILLSTESPWPAALSVIPEALVIFGYCRLHAPGLLGGIFRPIGIRSILLMIPVFLGLLGFEWFYGWLLTPTTTVEEWTWVGTYLSQGWPLWAAFLFLSVTPGFFEELAFRGFIQTKLEGVMGSKESLVVQAAMFSVLHLEPNWFATSFVFGLALGWLRRVTGSLVPGMIIHAAWNAMVIGWELGWFPWLW